MNRVTARECMAETTHFRRQRTYLACMIASRLADGHEYDLTFEAMYRRLEHTRRQLEWQQNNH